MSWTDERTDTLKRLWAEGDSCSQIAKKLGGVTRNAVIGKVHRLGISGRATPSRPVRVPRQNFVGKEHVGLLPAEPAGVVPNSLNQSLMKVAYPKVHGNSIVAVMHLKGSQCKWPVGDPHQEDFSFCCKSQHGQHQYCLEHLVASVHPQRQMAFREQLVLSDRVKAA